MVLIKFFCLHLKFWKKVFNIIYLEQTKKSEKNKENKNDYNSNNYDSNNSSAVTPKPNQNFKNIQTANINKEELLKFVYDISTQNLTASSFKYALRNLKDDQKEKEEYILVIKFKYFKF